MANVMSPNGENEIVIKDLVKRFGDVTAVNGLNLEIRKGEFFGFLGPNGAGKTTTISILCGLMKPTEGSAYFDGLDIRKDMDKIKQRIGVCPQETAVFKFLTGRENLELFGRLHGLEKQALKDRVDELLKQADFEEPARRRSKGYSGGMMRQLNLMLALVGDPEIVFLDEPTVGMDARARRRTWEYIGSLKDQGKTVILTTHDMQDIEALTERILLIGKGRILLDGNLSELLRRSSQRKTLTVDYSGASPSFCQGMTPVENKDGRLVASIDPAVLSISDAITSISAQVEVIDISVVGMTPEEMVAALYKEHGI